MTGYMIFLKETGQALGLNTRVLGLRSIFSHNMFFFSSKEIAEMLLTEKQSMNSSLVEIKKVTIHVEEVQHM